MERGLTTCYRHEGKLAIRNCERCGKPICRECGEESGDPSHCKPCALLIEEEKPGAKLKVKDGGRTRPTHGVTKDREEEPEPQTVGVKERRAAPFDVGEVTVFDDGRVVTAASGGMRAPAAPGEEPGEPEEEEEEPAPRKEKAPAVKTEATSKRLLEKPGAEEPAQRVGKPRVEEKEKPGKSGKPKRQPKPGKTPEERSEKAMRAAKLAPSGVGRMSAKAKKGAAKEGPIFSPTSRTRQFFYSLMYGLIAGSGVFLFWLVFAYFRRWTQISVVTAGIIIPWAMLKSSTAKKKDGNRVWRNTLPPFLASLGSLVLLTLLTMLAEYLAFLLVFRGSDLQNLYSLFAKKYLGGLEICLLVLGFFMTVVTSFVITKGKAVSKPLGGRKPGGPPGA